MFEYADIVESQFSSLGQGSRIQGELQLSGKVNINGQISGVIKMNDGSYLVIDRQGSIDGEIHCQEVDIYGTVTGKIFCQGRVLLRPSSHFEGSIESQTLTIFPGAHVNMVGHTL